MRELIIVTTYHTPLPIMEEINQDGHLEEIINALIRGVKGEESINDLENKYPELRQLAQESSFQDRLRDRLEAEYGDDLETINEEFEDHSQTGDISFEDQSRSDKDTLDRFVDEMKDCVPVMGEDDQLELILDLDEQLLSAKEFFSVANAFWLHFRHSSYCKGRYGDPQMEDPVIGDFAVVYPDFEQFAIRFCELDTPEHFGLGLELFIYHPHSNRLLIVHRDYQDDVYKFARYTRLIDPTMRLVDAKVKEEDGDEGKFDKIYLYIMVHPSMVPKNQVIPVY